MFLLFQVAKLLYDNSKSVCHSYCAFVHNFKVDYPILILSFSLPLSFSISVSLSFLQYLSFFPSLFHHSFYHFFFSLYISHYLSLSFHFSRFPHNSLFLTFFISPTSSLSFYLIIYLWVSVFFFLSFSCLSIFTKNVTPHNSSCYFISIFKSQIKIK